jgi:hypothetical protein
MMKNLEGTEVVMLMPDSVGEELRTEVWKGGMRGEELIEIEPERV